MERIWKRPDKFDDESVRIIADAIRNGNTKKDAAHAAGYSYEWVRQRLEIGRRDVEEEADTVNAALYLAVERAEAECAMSRQDALKRAAEGYATEVVRETVKTSLRTYKVKDGSGNTIERPVCRTITHPDGRIEEIPVEFVERTTETVTSDAFDWRPALEFLKRRYPAEWGDRQDITTGGEPLPPPSDPVVLASALAKLREAGVPLPDDMP